MTKKRSLIVLMLAVPFIVAGFVFGIWSVILIYADIASGEPIIKISPSATLLIMFFTVIVIIVMGFLANIKNKIIRNFLEKTGKTIFIASIIVGIGAPFVINFYVRQSLKERGYSLCERYRPFSNQRYTVEYWALEDHCDEMPERD